MLFERAPVFMHQTVSLTLSKLCVVSLQDISAGGERCTCRRGGGGGGGVEKDIAQYVKVVSGYQWEGARALLGRVEHGRREAHGRGGVGAWTRARARWVGGMVAEKRMAAERRRAWARGASGASVRRVSAWERRET